MSERGRIDTGAAPFVAGLVVVALVAFADGGYFRETWAWATIALSCLAGLALLLRERIAVSWPDLAMLSALAAFVGWVALSAAWSSFPSESLLEAERGLVYVAALLAFELVVPREHVRQLLAGIASGATLVAVSSLGARLVWAQPVEVDPIQGSRLIEPLGYANALGILAAVGLVLALGLAVRGPGRLERALAAAAAIPLIATVTWTESRGTALALLVGLGVFAFLDSRRSSLLATALVLAGPAAVAVWLTARSSVLTEAGGATVDESPEAGLGLALGLGALALASALSSFGAEWVEARLARSRRSARPLLGGLALALLGAVALAALRADRPLGPRFDYWGVAWRQWEENPWLGSGAGTFFAYWQREERPVDVLDAHSLYVETLAELGPVGLGLLLCALGLPLVAGARSRHPLAAVAAGGYTAYLVHAGLDWDWEMPAVTLTGLLCGVALLAVGRDDRSQIAIAGRGRLGLAIAAGILAAAALGAAAFPR